MKILSELWSLGHAVVVLLQLTLKHRGMFQDVKALWNKEEIEIEMNGINHTRIISVQPEE